MTDVPTLQRALAYSKKQTSYAWGKYYEAVNRRLTTDYNIHRTLQRTTTEEAIPTHIVTELKQMATDLRKTWECPICFEMIIPNGLEITNCGHYFCNPCLTELKHNNPTDCKCPVCRKKIAVRQ